jgi:hypothetical protein
LILSLSVFQALNDGDFEAAILIFSHVAGFLQSLAFLSVTLKVPKPVSATSSPFFN